jgi:hypothetical protein
MRGKAFHRRHTQAAVLVTVRVTARDLSVSPPPRQVGGKVVMDVAMPTMLSWVLGGNVGNVEVEDRVGFCRITDKPQAFDERVRMTDRQTEEQASGMLACLTTGMLGHMETNL